MILRQLFPKHKRNEFGVKDKNFQPEKRQDKMKVFNTKPFSREKPKGDL